MVADAKVTEFKSVIADTSITDTVVENLFDLMANTYNIFGCDVPIMDGTAGSKTVTYTSPQKGAIFQGARIVYASFYKNSSSTTSRSLGIISESNSSSVSDLMSNAAVWAMVKDIAVALKGIAADIPHIAFHVGQATS